MDIISNNYEFGYLPPGPFAYPTDRPWPEQLTPGALWTAFYCSYTIIYLSGPSINRVNSVKGGLLCALYLTITGPLLMCYRICCSKCLVYGPWDRLLYMCLALCGVLDVGGFPLISAYFIMIWLKIRTLTIPLSYIYN